MSTLPEPDPRNPEDTGAPEEAHSPDSPPGGNLPMEAWPSRTMPSEPACLPNETPAADQSNPEQPLFQSWAQPTVHPPVRIPHFGHLLLLIPLLGIGLTIAIVILLAGVHFHLFGVSTPEQSATDIHYLLGSEAILYLVTFACCLWVFPVFWHKSLLAGLQWNGATAIRLRWRLVGAAVVCLALALVSGMVMPGPSNAPIEEILKVPGAAWVLFAFGITFAPFFEETFFRGFILPALSTAYDWFAEETTGEPRRPLGENGHPQWSFSAMAVASVLTSIPFAALHAQQTGYSIGPFLLLVCVSIVLCAVRLSTRSLAASVMVHACYNFLLFSIMLAGTSGFRHLDKM